MIDHYTSLGLSLGASKEDIKTAFRQMAAKYHPDRNPDPSAPAHFCAARDAYEILSNCEQKEKHDEALRTRILENPTLTATGMWQYGLKQQLLNRNHSVQGNFPELNSAQSLAYVDHRQLVYRALSYGINHKIIDDDMMRTICGQAVDGIIQIAHTLDMAGLRPGLESALSRMEYLISFYLEYHFKDDLETAAKSLRDNHFLSHSKGGSNLLKVLHNKFIRQPDNSEIEDQGDARQEWLRFLASHTGKAKLTVAQYRRHIIDCDHKQLLTEAAATLCAAMGIDGEPDIIAQYPDTIIRSVLFVRGTTRCNANEYRFKLLTGDEFSSSLIALRPKGLVALKKMFSPCVYSDVPIKYEPAVKGLYEEMVDFHLPKIVDTSIAFNRLFEILGWMYYVRPNARGGNNGFGPLLTNEWHRATKGDSEKESINTVFLCICADIPPKPSISTNQAKSIVQSLRKNGANDQAVVTFIRNNAPVEMIDSLLEQWGKYFFPDLQNYVLDDEDAGLAAALDFLRDHCHLITSTRRTLLNKSKL